MTVAHKVANVRDEICAMCFQLWHGECRAYSVAHSKEEAEYRSQGMPKCDPIERKNEFGQRV